MGCAPGCGAHGCVCCGCPNAHAARFQMLPLSVTGVIHVPCIVAFYRHVEAPFRWQRHVHTLHGRATTTAGQHIPCRHQRQRWWPCGKPHVSTSHGGHFGGQLHVRRRRHPNLTGRRLRSSSCPPPPSLIFFFSLSLSSLCASLPLFLLRFLHMFGKPLFVHTVSFCAPSAGCFSLAHSLAFAPSTRRLLLTWPETGLYHTPYHRACASGHELFAGMCAWLERVDVG